MGFDIGTTYGIKTVVQVLGLAMPFYHSELVEVQGVVVNNPQSRQMEVVDGPDKVIVTFQNPEDANVFANGNQVTVKGVLVQTNTRTIQIRPDTTDSVTID